MWTRVWDVRNSTHTAWYDVASERQNTQTFSLRHYMCVFFVGRKHTILCGYLHSFLSIPNVLEQRPPSLGFYTSKFNPGYIVINWLLSPVANYSFNQHSADRRQNQYCTYVIFRHFKSLPALNRIHIWLQLTIFIIAHISEKINIILLLFRYS